MNGPSVLLIAPFDDARHSHSTQRVRALERLGCDVTSLDLLKRPTLLGRLGGGDLKSRLVKALHEAEAELVLVTGGGGNQLEESLVDSVRRAAGGAAKWVNWFDEDLGMVDQALRVAQEYDTVLVASSDVAERFQEKLGQPVEVLPHAADPSVYRPLHSKDQYRANVVFAGAATLDREALLVGLVEFGLALWGPGWRKTSLRDYCRGEARSTAEYVRAYGGASVAINLHHGGPNGAAYCNQRVFELAAMGIPQVVDQRADLLRWFEPERDLYVFQTWAEMRASVEAVLHDPPAAAEIAASARRTLLSRHTYMHRMQRVLEVAGLNRSAVSGER